MGDESFGHDTRNAESRTKTRAMIIWGAWPMGKRAAPFFVNP